jgi:hypothetical protein
MKKPSNGRTQTVRRKPNLAKIFEQPKKDSSRAKAKAWSKAQMAGLALRVRLSGERGLQTSKQIDAIVDSNSSSTEKMRDLATAASKEMAWMASQLIEFAGLLESGRFQISRRKGHPLSDREKRLAIAEKNVRAFRRGERVREQLGQKLPQVIGTDGRPITLTEDLVIESQVLNLGEGGNLFRRDDLEKQLAGERRSASRHKKAVKEGGR